MKTENLGEVCGQPIIREGEWEIVVLCPVCGEELNLRYGAYIEPSLGENGQYVHYDCLSQERKDELDINVEGLATD